MDNFGMVASMIFARSCRGMAWTAAQTSRNCRTLPGERGAEAAARRPGRRGAVPVPRPAARPRVRPAADREGVRVAAQAVAREVHPVAAAVHLPHASRAPRRYFRFFPHRLAPHREAVRQLLSPAAGRPIASPKALFRSSPDLRHAAPTVSVRTLPIYRFWPVLRMHAEPMAMREIRSAPSRG